VKTRHFRYHAWVGIHLKGANGAHKPLQVSLVRTVNRDHRRGLTSPGLDCSCQTGALLRRAGRTRRFAIVEGMEIA